MPSSDEPGGDDACWLDRICDVCGAIVEPGRAHVCRTPAEPREDTR